MKNYYRRKIYSVCTTMSAVAFISSCAHSTDKLANTYVSPLTFKGLDCEQVSAEMARISNSAYLLGASVNKNKDKNRWAFGIGGPALLFLSGDTLEAVEYSKLRGEYEALEKVGIEKKCGGRTKVNPFTQIDEAQSGRYQYKYPSSKGHK